MPSLTLELTADDLARHPNSLLSSLVASMTSDTIATASDSTDPAKQQPAGADNQHTLASGTARWLSAGKDGCTVDLVAMEFPVKGHLVVLDLTAAATLLETVYKHETIPQTVWEPLLDSCPRAASVSEQNKHDISLHDDVLRLFDYFLIPGPVARWLPPVETLNLQQWRLLDFVYSCHAVHSAKVAVNTMMAYKPHQESQKPAHTAVFFLLHDPTASTPLERLTVHVAAGSCSRLMAHIEEETDALRLRITADSEPPVYNSTRTDWPNDFCPVNWSQVDIDGNTGATSDIQELFNIGNPVGPTDCDLGQLLISNLKASVHGTRMMYGHLSLHSRTYDPMSAWVLRW